jgi:glutamate/aspartate transport system substrate-binding protein
MMPMLGSANIMRWIKAAFCVAATISSGLAARAHAEAPGSTLQHIAQSEKIRIGYGDTPPFSYLDADGKVIGYSIEICQKVVERLKEQLQLPRLEIEYVFRTPSNRVQLLNDGAIDIECNASTNTAERRKSVSFADSHFYVATRFVSLTKNNLKTLDDLKGRSVSVTFGTINIGQINQVSRDRKLNLSIIPADSLQASFQMVAGGRVAAYAMDDVLLSTMIAKMANPEDYQLSSEEVAPSEPYGFMMRLEDKAFQASVNNALREIYNSSEFSITYDRWFNQTIPKENINLRLPMSEQLRSAIKTPIMKK